MTVGGDIDAGRPGVTITTVGGDTNTKSPQVFCPPTGVQKRRWLIRLWAFCAILTYGIFIVSSPKQLRRLLDAAFVNDDVESEFYHNYVRATSRTNSSDADGASSSNIRISFELHDPKTVPLNNVFNPYNKCELGKVYAGRKANVPTGEFRSGKLPASLVAWTASRLLAASEAAACSTSPSRSPRI